VADDRTIRLVLTPPKTPELEVPEEVASDPVLQMLYSILQRLEALEAKFDDRYSDTEDYLYVEDSVSKTSPKDYDIVKTLGRVSKSGWIRNDGSAIIYVQFNGKDKIKLRRGEQFGWGRDAHRLVVRRIYVTTNSSNSQSFRIVAT